MATTEEANQNLEPTIPEDQQTAIAIEYSIPATPSPNLIEFPTPPSPQAAMQHTPGTHTTPTKHIPQAIGSEEESHLQEENETGKQNLHLKT